MNDVLQSMRAGSLLPVLGVRLLQPGGLVSVDLTDATSVEIEMTPITGDTASVTTDNPPMRVPANITNAPAGLVVYEWVPGDTDSPGRYFVRFIATFPSGRELGCPTAHRFIVEITP